MFLGHTEVDYIIQKLEKENKKVMVYAGFDPTGNSLHIGHLGVIVMLNKFIKAGHKVIALIGSGTAFIGDPTGKNEMRKMLSNNDIENNSKSIMKDIKSVIPNITFMENEWLKRINFQEFMREVGCKIPLTQLLNLSVVKTRLDAGNGITLMEAIYPVLQGWDMVVLGQMAKDSGFDGIIQVGGRDQTGNISMGIHLVNRMIDGYEAIGCMSELITTKSGEKMGKTSGNALFLSQSLVDDNLFYDSLMSLSDDVIPSLIDVLLPEMNKTQDIQKLKEEVAKNLTLMVRGKESLDQVLSSKKNGLDNANLKEFIFEPGFDINQIVKATGLTASLGECKRLIKNKGIKIDNHAIDDDTLIMNAQGTYILSKGKKHHVKVIIL